MSSSIIASISSSVGALSFSVGLWMTIAAEVSVAGYTAGQRAKHVPRGKYVAGVSILAGTAIAMFFLVFLPVLPSTPRYIIPVAGMMVGNAMTVTGVTMKNLRDDIKIQMNLIKTALALGETGASYNPLPVLDNAKTVGLISLPGTMTGLKMGGASPLEAIQLQPLAASCRRIFHGLLHQSLPVGN